jgi:hypothetical protein
MEHENGENTWKTIVYILMPFGNCRNNFSILSEFSMLLTFGIVAHYAERLLSLLQKEKANNG